MITYNVEKICVLQTKMCNPWTKLEKNPVILILLGKYWEHAINNNREVELQMAWKSIIFPFCLIKSWSHDQSE